MLATKRLRCGQPSRRGDAGLERARRDHFDLVLTDLKLPGSERLELVAQLHAAKPKLPIIIMTAHGTTDTAIEATKLGAYDYLVKPFEVHELLDLVATPSRQPAHVRAGGAGRSRLRARFAIIGNSRAMQAIYKEIGRVAAKPAPCSSAARPAPARN